MENKLFDQGDAFAILNRNQEILAINSALCALLGYFKHELKNCTAENIIHPTDIDEFNTAIARIIDNQTAFTKLKLRCITKQRQELKVYLSLDTLSLLNNSKESLQIVMTLQTRTQTGEPIEEHQQTQWFLQKTFDTIDQGVTIYDSHFRLVTWNKRYESFKIFPDQFLQRGTLLVDAYKAIAELGVFGAGDPVEQANEHIEALINKEVKPIEELRSLTGRLIEIRRYLMPEGGLVAVFTDITDQRSAEAQLRQAHKMEAVGQLTGGIAHDFNNILNIILGSLYLLEQQIEIDDNAQEHINTIKRTGQRAADLTRQLLAFSRIEATSRKTVNINRIIDNLGNLIIYSLTPQVELEYQFAEDLWATEIDPGEFEDALLNLALNARDAMSGRGRLTIETSNCVLDNSYCKLNPNASPGEYVQLIVSNVHEITSTT